MVYMSTFIVLCVGLASSVLVCAQHDKFITVREHPNSQGVSENLCVSHCSNFKNPKNIKLVSSINLQGNCARFYDEFNCSGKSFEVLPHSASHNHLPHINLNDRLRSVGPCRNECATDVTGIYNGEVIKVDLFSRTNYLGNVGTVLGTGCLSIPTEFSNSINSIRTNGQCIQLYSNPNCSNAAGSSIELRQDSYFLNELSKWNFPSVSSLAHCRYKCESTTKSSKIEDVTIFDQVNYTGSWLKVRINNCTNLPYQWEMGLKSLQLTNGTCAELYEDFDCIGDPFIAKSANLANLAKTREMKRTRSIRSCITELEQTSVSNKFLLGENNMERHTNDNYLQPTMRRNLEQFGPPEPSEKYLGDFLASNPIYEDL